MNHLLERPSLHHHRGLLSMLGVATILHIVGLCLFKVVAPPAQPSPVLPATFYVFHSDSPNSAAFYTWLEAEDPALFTQTTPTTRENILFPDIPYVPSYELTMKNRPPQLAPPLP